MLQSPSFSIIVNADRTVGRESSHLPPVALIMLRLWRSAPSGQALQALLLAGLVWPQSFVLQEGFLQFVPDRLHGPISPGACPLATHCARLEVWHLACLDGQHYDTWSPVCKSRRPVERSLYTASGSKHPILANPCFAKWTWTVTTTCTDHQHIGVWNHAWSSIKEVDEIRQR